MRTRAPDNARAVAARLVARWIRTGDFPDRLMESVAAHRAVVMEMAYGTVKWRRQLEWILKRLVRRLPDEELAAHLLVGLYQLFHMSDVADYAAVSETVEAVKTGFPRRTSDFVNAVLRRALRERAAIEAALRGQPPAVRLSHPDVLVERWTAHWGEKNTLRLCEWNNGRANVVLRVNAAVPVAEYAARLERAGVRAIPHPFRPESCLILEGGGKGRDGAGAAGGVQALPGYEEGVFSVQDPSGMPAVDLLDPRPGEVILDGCAAPGGKTLLIAERMKRQGRLVAVDRYEDRLARLRENLARAGVSAHEKKTRKGGESPAFVRVLRADLTEADDTLRSGGLAPERGFDGVLLDVPCSNTGVLRRRPDARWRFSMPRLAKLVSLQRALLDTAGRLVRPGGRLVYSTCSLEPEECEAMVASWKQDHGDFDVSTEVRLFPPDTGTDGAYAARLQRRPLRP